MTTQLSKDAETKKQELAGVRKEMENLRRKEKELTKALRNEARSDLNKWLSEKP